MECFVGGFRILALGMSWLEPSVLGAILIDAAAVLLLESVLVFLSVLLSIAGMLNH